jgi:hypothetical protein
LRERYPQMLSEDWNEDDGKVGEEQLAKMATPRDYVEKIFQVPFWLKPMNDTASRQLLEGLIPETQLLRSPQTNGNRDTTSQAQTVGGKERPITGGNGSGNVPGELAGKVAGSTSPEESNDKSATKTVGEAKSSAQAGGTSDAMHKKPGRVLKPENLLLDVTERDAMIALSKVIGRTPRTLKRFVNVYRIIKAGLDGEDLKHSWALVLQMLSM